MQFWKMNGAGNDFIILNNLKEHLFLDTFPLIAKKLCERHLSIGADGLMVVDAPEQGGDFKIRFYNSDGSLGEMCGNGARCICRYGFENNLASEQQTIETASGIVTGQRIDKRHYKIRLNNPTLIQTGRTLDVDGTSYPYSYVELGTPGLPHAVVPFPNLKSADENFLRELGRKIRWHKAFPKGANVNFYELLAPNSLYERTFERGVEDFTYACGTGTASVVTILTLSGQVSGQNVHATMQGGILTIDVLRNQDQITDLYLTGPTNIVATGEVTDEDLSL